MAAYFPHYVRYETGASVLPGLAAPKQVAPVVLGDVDFEALGRGLDAFPGSVSLGIADAFDLVETGDGIPDVLGISERLLPFGGKGKF
jgi:hypothetical protein